MTSSKPDADHEEAKFIDEMMSGLTNKEKKDMVHFTSSLGLHFCVQIQTGTCPFPKITLECVYDAEYRAWMDEVERAFLKSLGYDVDFVYEPCKCEYPYCNDCL